MDKTKALESAMRQIEKDFGKGSIMKLGEQAIMADIAVIPTGSLGLDQFEREMARWDGETRR